MPAKITSVTSKPGSPPTLVIQGTWELPCDGVIETRVSVNGTWTQSPILNIQKSGLNWQITVEDNFPCNTQVIIITECKTTNVTQATIPYTFTTRPCNPSACPTLRIATNIHSNCSVKSHYTFTVYSGNGVPLPANQDYLWTINGPTGSFQFVTQTLTVDTSDPVWENVNVVPALPGPVDLFTAGTYTVTVSYLNGNTATCHPVGGPITFEIKDCCPDRQYWNDVKKACDDCLTIGVDVNTIGCAPEGFPRIDLQARFINPPPPGTVFEWTVQRVTVPIGPEFKKTTLSLRTSDGITDGYWTDHNQVQGPLDLSNPGTYLVEVAAKGPNIPVKCSPLGKQTFFINPCSCPEGQHFDPVSGKCVVDDCGPGKVRNADGKCIDDCPPGQTRDASGNCVTPECPKGQHRDATGVCVPDLSCDLCCIWNWINLGLFGLTAIFVIVTLCMLSATAAGAIVALFSGGTLAAVGAALTIVNIVMLYVSAGLITAGLASLIIWMLVCIVDSPNACTLLGTLAEILGIIVATSSIISFVLLFIAPVCAIGGLLNLAWFGTLLGIINFIYFTILGCNKKK